jgi:hypothetical protein
MVKKIVYLLVVVGFAVEVVVGGVPAEPPLPGLDRSHNAVHRQ